MRKKWQNWFIFGWVLYSLFLETCTRTRICFCPKDLSQFSLFLVRTHVLSLLTIFVRPPGLNCIYLSQCKGSKTPVCVSNFKRKWSLCVSLPCSSSSKVILCIYRIMKVLMEVLNFKQKQTKRRKILKVLEFQIRIIIQNTTQAIIIALNTHVITVVKLQITLKRCVPIFLFLYPATCFESLVAKWRSRVYSFNEFLTAQTFILSLNWNTKFR